MQQQEPIEQETTATIIMLKNNSNQDVLDFEFINAEKQHNHPGFKDGSLTIGDVTISSSISNITYQQMVAGMVANPLTVGLTFFQFVTPPTGEFIFTIKSEEEYKLSSMAESPQNPVTIYKQPYLIDSKTRLSVSYIPANSFIYVFMFMPANDFIEITPAFIVETDNPND